jgi:hypothetical protein
MTREEAIRIVSRFRDVWDDSTTPSAEALDMAIKALEQEPIIDKIRERVELEKLGYPPSAGYYKAIIKVLKIIDKYKAESEDKE